MTSSPATRRLVLALACLLVAVVVAIGEWEVYKLRLRAAEGDARREVIVSEIRQMLLDARTERAELRAALEELLGRK